MISVSPKPLTFIQLYILVSIATRLVYKHRKCREKILEMAEFIYYLSRTSLIFLNALQSQIYSCFIVRGIQMPIILQQHISCTSYPRKLCIKPVNNNLFFLALPTSTLAMSMASCMAMTLVCRILCSKIYNSYSFLLVRP